MAVEGVIVEDRIDEAYLRQWEQQLEAAAQSSAQEHATQGCCVEQQARGESATATARTRIENYRQKIAQRKQQQGKDYLSFYHAEAFCLPDQHITLSLLLLFAKGIFFSERALHPVFWAQEKQIFGSGKRGGNTPYSKMSEKPHEWDACAG